MACGGSKEWASGMSESVVTINREIESESRRPHSTRWCTGLERQWLQVLSGSD
jgi:hypothetical protein